MKITAMSMKLRSENSVSFQLNIANLQNEVVVINHRINLDNGGSKCPERAKNCRLKGCCVSQLLPTRVRDARTN